MGRQEGATTEQIKAAPHGAIYVWVNSNTRYPKDLARTLGREDIQFVAPSWLDSHNWRGRAFSAIILDHAARLTDTQWDGLIEVRRRTNDT